MIGGGGVGGEGALGALRWLPMTPRTRLVALRSSPRARLGAVLLAVVLVGGGVLLAHPWGRAGDRATLTQEPAVQPVETAPATATASATASPSATPTVTSAPPPTAAATSSSGGGGGGGDGLGPHPPGSVTVAYTSGQHTWSGTSSGMTIHASISPTTPHAGSPVTFTVHVSGPENDCCAVYIVFGDGGTTGDISCPTPTTGGSATATFTHTYNKPGLHSMLIQAISNKCQDNGELYGTIDIGDGPSTAQGPSLPTVTFSESTPAQDPYYRTVTLYGEADDKDGHVTKLVVTFGDGTSHTFGGDPMTCQPTKDGWPGPSQAMLPYDPKPYAHSYSKGGTYTLRLTAYSAGCDGTDVQKGSATFTFTAGPGPTPSPSPTKSPSPTPSTEPSPSPSAVP